MEASDEENTINKYNDDHQEQPPSKWKKLSFITMPFIIANESFEKVASYGLSPNMIVYLMKDYNMSLAKAQNLIFFWSAATNFFPLIGAFVADSYLGRFLTIAIGSIFSLLGMTILWLTTIIPNAKPQSCNSLAHECKSPTSGQYALLVLAFLIMSIGAGGVRPCSLAFGADQVARTSDDPNKNKKNLGLFFCWYYASACCSVIIAMTVIVYIQDHLGWRIGFGTPIIFMLLSTICLFLATPLYVMNKVESSLFNSLVRVAIAAFRNRKITLPPRGSNVRYYLRKDSALPIPSDRLRCLNKACIVQNFHHDIGYDGKAKNPWKLCTVEEVEELKALIRILPIWLAGVMMSIHANQGSFGVVQALSMDRHLTSRFEIPAASFNFFQLIVIVLWIPTYDYVLLPLASRINGNPIRLSVKLRMGLGLFCAFMSMFVAGIVENIRRKRAISKGLENDSQVIFMSAFWLVPQYCFSGLAEAFTAIGQNEFFYTEMPKSMSSIATCLFGVGMGVAGVLSSVILNLVNDITRRGGKESWVSSNINKGHYDYYYWVIASICFFNVLYYMFCSWCYESVEVQKEVVIETPVVKLEDKSLLENEELKEG